MLNPNSSQSTGPPRNKENSTRTSTTGDDAHAIAYSGWVSKRDRRLQNLNSSLLAAQTKQNLLVFTNGDKALADQSCLESQILHIDSPDLRNPEQRSNPYKPPREVPVDGVTFRVTGGGSKLSRIRGELCQ